MLGSRKNNFEAITELRHLQMIFCHIFYLMKSCLGPMDLDGEETPEWFLGKVSEPNLGNKE